MPPAIDQIDLETLLRDAVSGVAVAAYARGVGLSAHIDNRLSARVLGDAAELQGILRRGLSRMIEAGRDSRIALAFWLDDKERILLEACRWSPEEDRPSTGLADLWNLPGGAGAARPSAAGDAGEAETVLLPLPCAPDPEAAPMARKWGGAFRGRSILFVRKALFDCERARVSLAATGLKADFATSAAAALDLAGRRAAEGGVIDFLVVDNALEDGGAVALAREFRADPSLAGTRIVLWDDLRRPALADEDSGLFDVVSGGLRPWRRLLDVVYELSRSLGDDQEAAPEEAPDAGNLPRLAGKRILIAEDVATNQVLLRAVLQPTGAEVETVADGSELLERHAEALADLILMDLQMPGMGGIAAVRHLRALGDGTGEVPVVALTAYARRSDRKLALDAGMDAYLAKPIVVAEFYELLRRLLPEAKAGSV